MPEARRQSGQFHVRTEPVFRNLLDRMAEANGTDISGYLRGLALIDAVMHGEGIDGIAVPGWATGEVMRLVRDAALQNRRGNKK